MATSSEKFQIVIEAQENASRKIRRLNKAIADAGGPKMLKTVKELKALERQAKSLGIATQKTNKVWTRFTKGIAIGNIAANLASQAMGLLTKGIKQLGETVMVAANVEELGGVLEFVGDKAGYSARQLNKHRQSLLDAGIAQKETNQAMLRAIQGNIKLTDAVKIGRIAQDAATIGQVNSSEAFQTLIDSVVKGRVVLLKSLGIQGTFQQSYKEMARTLGKTQTELTETERLQARLNLVFKGGEVIAGAYDTAMGFASKKLRSMDRHVQNLQVAIGSHLTPAFGILVDEMTVFIKQSTAAFEGDDARTLAFRIADIANAAMLTGKVMFNLGQIVWNTFQLMILDPIDSVFIAMSALVVALKDPFNLDAWVAAGHVLSEIPKTFSDDWLDIKGHIEDSTDAVEQFAVTALKIDVERAKAGVETVVNDIRDIPAIVEETEDEILEMSGVISHGIVETASVAQKAVRNLQGAATQIMGRGIGNMVDAMVGGRQSMGEIFKGMAQDFMSFFIKQALFSIVSSFIPGLGGLLGHMFDTPVNDRMAANQGRDFAQWFTRGMLAEMQGGTEMAVGISQSAGGGGGRSIPAVASGGGGGGGGGSNMVVMHVSISGNVMSEEFVEDKIAPKLRSLVDDGRSLLETQDENVTGGRDVSIN